MKYFLLLCLLLLIGCSQPSLSRERASELAENKFKKFLLQNELERLDFSNRINTTMAGATYAFEWKHLEEDNTFVLIYFDKNGLIHLSFNDQKGVFNKQENN